MKAYGSALQLKTAVQSFWNNYFALPDPFEGLLYTRTSTQKTDTYARLGAAPMPTAWVGNRNVKDVNEYSFSVVNNNYDASVRVDKDLVRFEQWGEIANLLGNLGTKARALIPSLTTTTMVAGTAAVCEDGQYFYDTDHASPGAEYTTSQDNDLTGTAATNTQPTAAETLTALRAMFAQLYSYKDDRGDPMAPVDVMDPANFVVMIPPVYLGPFRQVLNAETITAAGDNDLKGTFTLRINPYITTVNQCFMHYRGSDHKPFIVQQASGVELTEEREHGTGDYVYSASWAGNIGYGEWRTTVSYIFS